MRVNKNGIRVLDTKPPTRKVLANKFVRVDYSGEYREVFRFEPAETLVRWHPYKNF